MLCIATKVFFAEKRSFFPANILVLTHQLVLKKDFVLQAVQFAVLDDG